MTRPRLRQKCGGSHGRAECFGGPIARIRVLCRRLGQVDTCQGFSVRPITTLHMNGANAEHAGCPGRGCIIRSSMGPRRELQRGNQWSPSRLEKNGYRCAFDGMSWSAMQADGCRTNKVHKLKLDPDPSSPRRIGGRISSELLQRNVSELADFGTLAGPPAETVRKTGTARGSRAGHASFEMELPRLGEKKHS